MQEQSTRTCSRCEQMKPLSEFHRRASRASGYASHCKACDKLRTARWYAEHAEQARAYDRAYRAQHPEKGAAQWARWYAAHQAERAARETERAATWRRENLDAARTLERARHAVRRALRRGDLIRPSSCEACGRTAKIQAAHASYDPQHWLDVRWLCRPCHARWDAAEPKLFKA